MKQRFSSLDVKVISRELSSALVGLRISNIYDLSSRICLFKFAKPDVRRQLIVDVGFRCHLTNYTRTTAAVPSAFISRLRKFLKTRRVTAINQIGTDRIIDIELSDGHFHLLLEFYAGGNIILTDSEYQIIALHRIVPAGTEQEELRVGLKYVLENKQNYGGVAPVGVERLKEALKKAAVEAAEGTGEGAPTNNKRAKKKQAEALRRAISFGFPEYPPLLLEHAFHVTGFDTSLKPEQVLADEGLIEKLMLALQEAERVDSQLSTAQDTPGYIIAQSETGKPDEPPKMLYQDFHPFSPHQFHNAPNTTILPFPSFNTAVDEYFSSVESQKLSSRLTEREELAKRKLDAAHKDHEKRVGALQQVQELHIRKAQAIEANLYRVEEAMNAVNGLIAQGMDWVEIARLIEMEQGRGNEVARVIKLPLKLYENTVTLLLGEPGEEGEESDDEDEESSEEDEDENEDAKAKAKAKAKSQQQQLLSIDIDLGISPWANARQYYEQKKAAAVKEEKTLKSSKKAIKSTEKKVAADLKQALKQEKPVLRPARTPFWFEKFIHFVSSDGYLVLGGRDAQQTEILYRRHLKKGDVYVHADVQGAIPLIVKNKPGTPDAPIPPGTLSQAGNLCVATSIAWDSKALMGAWWVKAEQVSKTTETGEFVATGGFVIRGEKNQLAPAQLLLGFAVMFLISEESVKNHTKHRVQEGVEGTAGVNRGEKVEKGSEVVEEQGTVAETEVGRVGDGEDVEVASSSDEDGDGGAEGDEGQKSANPLLGGGAKAESNHSENEEEEEGEGEQLDKAPDGILEPAEVTAQPAIPEEKSNPPENNTDLKKPPTKHLSAHERRLLKKGLSTPTPSSSHPSPSRPSTPSSLTPSTSPTTTTTTTAPTVRGKRGKSKKLATKYQHQDDEDRELALRLLGAAPNSEKGKEKKSSAAAAKSKAAREAEAEAVKARRRAQHDKAARAEAERQRVLAAQSQSGGHGDGVLGGSAGGGGGGGDEGEGEVEVETEDLSCLPALVGTPVMGDEVLAALPVCAPWAALGQYVFRAKLQPGTVKKGKAVREVVGRWVVEGGNRVREMERVGGRGKKGGEGEGKGRDADADTDGNENENENVEDEGHGGGDGDAKQLAMVELELIKGWRDAEVVNTLPVSKVKVISGGGGGKDGGDKGGKGKGGGGKGGGKGGKGGKGKK
ncbi:hypothetical protein FQN52_004970 [Onygenales sp. PD_12]|nr:hypothetical protein FQN52_004970 [Onygenales sp. PD_12]